MESTPVRSAGKVVTQLPRGSASATRAVALVATLLLRACVNAAFAVWLFTRAPVWLDIFSAGAVYALADGTFGLISVLLLLRQPQFAVPPQLVAMVLVDAILRCAAGIAILALPGFPYFPITLVLLYGTLGTWAASAGVMAMVAWLIAHAREKSAGRRSGSRVHALFHPFEAAGLLALGLAGYAFLVGPPVTAGTLRTAAGAASAALGLIFLVAAVGAALFPTLRAEA